MIQESTEQQSKVISLLQSAYAKLSQNQLRQLFEQARTFIFEQCKKQQLADVVYNLLTAITNAKLFTSILHIVTDNLTSRNSVDLQHSLIKFIQQGFTKLNPEPDLRWKHSIVMDVLLENNANLLQRTVELCRDSQSMSLSVLNSASQALIRRIREKSATNINITFTILLALKVIQCWQSTGPNLVSQALRHILVVDLIQKGQVCILITENHGLLTALGLMGQGPGYLNGYWFLLASKLNELPVEGNRCSSSEIAQLSEQAFRIILETVQKGKDLSSEVYNINHSSLQLAERQKMTQLIRGYCIFVASYSRKQIKQGFLEESLIQLIEQLMDIKDFLSFEALVTPYAQICQLDQQRRLKLPVEMVQRIERNCLPIYKNTELIIHSEVKSNEIAFLENRQQSQYRYESGQAGSQSMQFLLDKILEERGCRPKPKICPCFESYMHSTIEMQYDQQFNEHDFVSVANLMCREVLRVIALNPEGDQLEVLKTYMLDNLKWLLNLNESCLAQHKRCINFKIFDLILTFPPILNHNEFLQQVLEDLLVERTPQTFYHIGKLIQFYRNQQQTPNTAGLERIGEKVLAKASQQGLTLSDKINIWNFVLIIWQPNKEKLKELLQLYSLHEEHWIAKHLASKYRKLNIMEIYTKKLADIEQNWNKNAAFHSQELRIMRLYSKQR